MVGEPRAEFKETPEGAATDAVLMTTEPTAEVNDCPVMFGCAPA